MGQMFVPPQTVRNEREHRKINREKPIGRARFEKWLMNEVVGNSVQNPPDANPDREWIRQDQAKGKKSGAGQQKPHIRRVAQTQNLADPRENGCRTVRSGSRDIGREGSRRHLRLGLFR